MARNTSRAGHDATKADDNPLWIYALKQYKADNCAQFLIQAQDELGIDVNILLFIGWLAANNLKIDMQVIMHSSAYAWQQDVIKPIREIRRTTKAYGQESIYQQILALEISTEKQQLQDFYQLSLNFEQDIQGFTRALELGCGEYFKAHKKSLQNSWLQTLIEHLQPNN